MSLPPFARSALRLTTASLLAAAVLAWLLRDAPVSALVADARALPAWAWLCAAAAMTGTYLLRAARLHYEWAHVERVGLFECLRLVLAHNVSLMLLPMRAGEFGYVWLVQRRWRVGFRDAMLSLAWLRVQDGVVLAAFAVGVLPAWPAPARVSLALSLCVVASTAIPALVRAGRNRWAWLGRIADAMLAHRNDTTGWVCCVANWSLKLAVIAMLYAALAQLPADVALRAALGGELAGATPVQGPAGLGTYELGAWAMAGIGGVPGDRVAPAALLIHGFLIAVAMVLAAAVHAPRGSTRPAATAPEA